MCKLYLNCPDYLIHFVLLWSGYGASLFFYLNMKLKYLLPHEDVLLFGGDEVTVGQRRNQDVLRHRGVLDQMSYYKYYEPLPREPWQSAQWHVEYIRHNNTKSDDTMHNDTQHNNNEKWDTQRYFMKSVVILRAVAPNLCVGIIS